jgi:hypothetical protein
METVLLALQRSEAGGTTIEILSFRALLLLLLEEQAGPRFALESTTWLVPTGGFLHFKTPRLGTNPVEKGFHDEALLECDSPYVLLNSTASV